MTVREEAPGRRRRRVGLGVGLGTMAALHALAPRPFERLVPAWVPGTPRFWNLASGAAEGVAAGLLLRRGTSRAGGAVAFGTLATVYVANVQAVVDGGTPGAPGWFGTRQAAVARLPLQVPMLWVAWRLWRDPDG